MAGDPAWEVAPVSLERQASSNEASDIGIGVGSRLVLVCEVEKRKLALRRRTVVEFACCEGVKSTLHCINLCSWPVHPFLVWQLA